MSENLRNRYSFLGVEDCHFLNQVGKHGLEIFKHLFDLRSRMRNFAFLQHCSRNIRLQTPNILICRVTCVK